MAIDLSESASKGITIFNAMKGIQDQEYDRSRKIKQNSDADSLEKRRKAEIGKWAQDYPQYSSLIPSTEPTGVAANGLTAPTTPQSAPDQGSQVTTQVQPAQTPSAQGQIQSQPNPVASGVNKPAPRMELNPMLDLQSRMAFFDLKEGNPNGVIQLRNTMQKLKDEGVPRSLMLFKQGRDKEAFDSFNSTGQEKLTPVSSENGIYVTPNGDKVPTRIITARRSDGTTTTINTAETEFRMLGAEKLIELGQKSRDTAVKERDVVTKEQGAKTDALKAQTEAKSGGKPTDLMQNTKFIMSVIPGIDQREAVAIAQGKSDTFSTTPDAMGGMSLVNKSTGESWTYDMNGKETGHYLAKKTLRGGADAPPPNPPPPRNPGVKASDFD